MNQERASQHAHRFQTYRLMTGENCPGFGDSAAVTALPDRMPHLGHMPSCGLRSCGQPGSEAARMPKGKSQGDKGASSSQ